MKKIILIITSVCLFVCTGCENFLDSTNYSKKDSSNFPISEIDAYQLITGIYSNLPASFEDVVQNPIFVAYMASDEALGGGSTSNIIAQSFDRMQCSAIDEFSTIWELCWQGVFRANNAILTIPTIADEEWEEYDRDDLIGQAHFLRAFYYWELVDLFEAVPLITETTPVNLPKASVDELYALITSDLLKAIELIDDQKYGEFEKGRASKWTAEGYLARIFLFYTGFYKKDGLPTQEGTTVSKSDVINYLEDCIYNSGFALVSDQRNLWPYTNEYTKWHYKYTIDNDLRWEGNGSKETMWNVRFNFFTGQHNRLPEYLGLRYRSGGTTTRESFPYGEGYTNGALNPRFVQEWRDNPNYGETDKRLWGSVLDVKKELPDHQGDVTKEVERSDYHGKKYIVVTTFPSADSDPATDEPYENYTYIFTNTNNSNQYGNRDDIIYMRFADVLLMHSELTETPDGINQIRARAGLEPIGGYTLEALQSERKYELAFEGIRWNDLRRWYPDTAGEIIEKAQEGAITRYRENTNVPYQWQAGNGFAKRYAETRGFFRIPETEVNLSEGVLEQNAGWTDGSWMLVSLPYTF
jgi:hypothetical protein